MIKKTLYCDMCGKKVPKLSTFIVLFGHSGLKIRDFNQYSKYKAVYNNEICDKCVGSKFFECYGDTAATSLKDKGMAFLNKLFNGLTNKKD